MHNETILVVDDSKEVREFLCYSVLNTEGYQVISAQNGTLGLKLAIENKPDLIILDINLPEISGLEVMKELKQGGYDIPYIVITSYGSEESILESLRLGAKDFLQKPFTVEEVLNAVSRALAESRWQKERAQMASNLTIANLRLQEQVKAWESLNVIGQAITSTLEEKDVQRRLMWGINQLMQVEAGSMYLIDEETQELILQISLREQMERPSGLHLKLGQGIAGWVAKFGRPALVPDAQKDERFFAESDKGTGFFTRSVLAVPLTIKGKVLGVIQVINPYGTKNQFDQADQKLLEALAASVAVAVENARLHAEVRQTVTIETLKKTMVTLSHYLYNYLTALNGNLSLLKEQLQQQNADPSLFQMLKESQESASHIQTVLQALQRVTQVRGITYADDTQMIDI
jgi:DNA-binding response OmpR family regulator/putative methionine-R-sulfoxide reductase with GAF domain